MSQKADFELNFHITKHAKTRMQQRSFSETDLSTIAQCGTAINDQEIYLSNRDIERETTQLREQIRKLECRIKKSRNQICGTKVSVTSKKLHSAIVELRNQVRCLERLRNRKIVLKGNTIVTCYHCSKSELKRISRILN